MIRDIIELINLFVVSMAFSGGIYFHKKVFKTAKDKHREFGLFAASIILWVSDFAINRCNSEHASFLYMITDIIAISACYLGGAEAEKQVEILYSLKDDETKRKATHKLLYCLAVIPVFAFILRTVFIHGW